MARKFYSALSLDRIEPVSDGEAVRVLGQVLGNRLRAVREAKGLTQQDVASRVSGLTASALSNSTPVMKRPAARMMMEIMVLFGIRSTSMKISLIIEPHTQDFKLDNITLAIPFHDTVLNHYKSDKEQSSIYIYLHKNREPDNKPSCQTKSSDCIFEICKL